jgi:MSHA biogenesis protein MshP
MTRSSFSRLAARRRSAGMGLVTAIFLLVVLAGLGVAMVNIFTSQQQSSNLDVQGARAYQAARAGIDWGLFQQLRNGWCKDANDRATFQLPGASSLSAFTVIVQCTVTAEPVKRWVIEATACNQLAADGSCGNASNSPDYVERKVEVQI